MGARDFIDVAYIEMSCQSVKERITHFNEFIETLSDEKAKLQASRCMDCGIPFCQHRCPLHNSMPDFNKFVAQERWYEAYLALIKNNDFPEITGRICPALCQESCCLGLYQEHEVGIKSIERKIIDYAYKHGFVKKFQGAERIGKKVAIVGSGPAALACAIRLNRYGVDVSVFEKMDNIGGLLRYGIPDFKLSKEVLDRKLMLMQEEGIKFYTKTLIASKDVDLGAVHSDHDKVISLEQLQQDFDAVVLAVGSEEPRDLKIKGRELNGIYFALDFLIAQNKENNLAYVNPVDVKGKDVVVIGGGETASDCIGVAIRKGAKSVTQLDYHHKLPDSVDVHKVWPDPRHILHTSTSQQEGCTRLFATNTTAFVGKDKLEAIDTVEVTWGEKRTITPIEGTQKQIKADIALIAMGYSHPVTNIFNKLSLDERKNIKATTSGNNAYKLDGDKLFVAGDCRRGQSLVVYALAEGRDCALQVYNYLIQA